MAIPDLAPADDNAPSSALTHDEWAALFSDLSSQLGEYARYWEVYDPIRPEPDDPTAGNLADDLADIYRDLRDSLVGWRHWEAEQRQNALWPWRFNFQGHWGAHAVDAARAIHWLLHEHYIEVAERDSEDSIDEDA
jgi:hypothetical protein